MNGSPKPRLGGGGDDDGRRRRRVRSSSSSGAHRSNAERGGGDPEMRTGAALRFIFSAASAARARISDTTRSDKMPLAAFVRRVRCLARCFAPCGSARCLGAWRRARARPSGGTAADVRSRPRRALTNAVGEGCAAAGARVPGRVSSGQHAGRTRACPPSVSHRSPTWRCRHPHHHQWHHQWHALPANGGCRCSAERTTAEEEGCRTLLSACCWGSGDGRRSTVMLRARWQNGDQTRSCKGVTACLK